MDHSLRRHWYILAHQNTKKVDANSYATEMAGIKYKLAHKRADKETWSSSTKAQRKRLIRVLKETIAELAKEPLEAAHPSHKTANSSSTASNGSAARLQPLGTRREASMLRPLNDRLRGCTQVGRRATGNRRPRARSRSRIPRRLVRFTHRVRARIAAHRRVASCAQRTTRKCVRPKIVDGSY